MCANLLCEVTVKVEVTRDWLVCNVIRTTIG